MGVYINKAELLKELSVIQDRPVHSAMQIIKILPTIDLVRCGECKHWNKGFCNNGRADANLKLDKNCFCDEGERRADD